MFVIRRNLPLAWAGWRDSFQRPPENPLKPPWKHLGGGESYINNLEELVVTEQTVNDDGRGPSYEWQPFTPNWGFEAEIYYPVEGIDNQHFYIVFTDSWVRIGSDLFQKAAAVGFKHELGGDDNIAYGEFDSMFTPVAVNGLWDSPVGAFFGQTLRIRIWCENDQWLRIWLNDFYVGSVMPTEAYKLSPLRRCVRFLNRSYCNVYIREVNHYDRPPTVPPKTVWSEVFSDDFNRPNGSVGNGWTQYGTNAGIEETDRFTHTGTTNSSEGIIRSIGDANGRARIEAQIRNPSTSDCSLVLFANSAGTQGLTANVFQNRVYLGRLTAALNTPSFYDFMNRGISVADGDVIAFSVYNEICWFEVNGVVKAYAGNVHDVVPDSNPWAGLRVEREADVRSGQFDWVKIYTGVGV